MKAFWKSLLLAFSIWGCVLGPMMAISGLFAHLSYNSELKRSIATVNLWLALPILIFGIVGMVVAIKSNPLFAVPPDARTNPLAVISLVLSFSGCLTLGMGSIAGVVVGIIALRRICAQGQHGQALAIAGIATSCCMISFLYAMLFLGP